MPVPLLEVLIGLILAMNKNLRPRHTMSTPGPDVSAQPLVRFVLVTCSVKMCMYAAERCHTLIWPDTTLLCYPGPIRLAIGLRHISRQA
jgi:hypothetical protein